MSISLDIFTTLPLEDAQGLHLVLKDGSSYMTAISKGQDTHTEKPSFSLTFSKHTVAMRHLAPTTVPPKAPNDCQFPCANLQGEFLKKQFFAEEFHFGWDGHQKFTVSPWMVDQFLVTWPNIKIAAIKWNCEGQMRY